MKKYIYYIAALTMASFLGSCEDFLDTTSYTQKQPAISQLPRQTSI